MVIGVLECGGFEGFNCCVWGLDVWVVVLFVYLKVRGIWGYLKGRRMCVVYGIVVLGNLGSNLLVFEVCVFCIVNVNILVS